MADLALGPPVHRRLHGEGPRTGRGRGAEHRRRPRSPGHPAGRLRRPGRRGLGGGRGGGRSHLQRGLRGVTAWLARRRRAGSSTVRAPNCSTGAMLHTRITERLASVAATHLPARSSGVRSNLARTCPTTLAMAVLRDTGGELAIEALWAGDSRVFLLTPKAGLQQLTADHVRDADVLHQLANDSPMSNMVCASNRFEITTSRVVHTGAGVVLCATDGVFGYVRTPGEVECVLLQTLQASERCRFLGRAAGRPDQRLHRRRRHPGRRGDRLQGLQEPPVRLRGTGRRRRRRATPTLRQRGSQRPRRRRVDPGRDLEQVSDRLHRAHAWW